MSPEDLDRLVALDLAAEDDVLDDVDLDAWLEALRPTLRFQLARLRAAFSLLGADLSLAADRWTGRAPRRHPSHQAPHQDPDQEPPGPA